MLINDLPRYEILDEAALAELERGWRRIVSELGIEFLHPEALEVLPERRPGRRGRARPLRPRLDPRAGREGAARVRRSRRATPSAASTSAATTWSSPRSTAARSCAREPSAATRPTTTSRTSCKLAQSFPQLDSPGGTICEPNDRPLDSRHLDMVFALLTLSDKPFMGSVTSGPNAVDTIAMAEIVFGRESLEQTPAIISLINVNSPLRYDDRMLSALVEYAKARAGDGDHAVPAHGRDVAGLDCRHARAAGRRGARGDRARADDPPRLSRRVRLVPLEHRHAVRVAELRHAGVGRRPALHGPDRAALQPAVPRRRCAHLVAGRRRAGRLRVDDVALADLPRRHELRHALGRLARVGARLLLREVRRRRRAAPDVARGVRATRGSTRRRSRTRRTRRSARAATSSARRTRSSGSASASTGRSSPRPRTTSAGTATAPTTRPHGRPRSGRRRSRSTRSRRSTPTSRRSSRRSSTGAGPSWGIEMQTVGEVMSRTSADRRRDRDADRRSRTDARRAESERRSS